MGYLLSIGVIAFQLAILITIIGAGRAGKKALNLVTLGWICFTLFGSIFTAGLLLLQLLTIAVAYAIGNPSPKAKNQPVPEQGKATSGESSWALIAFLIVAGVATGKFLGRQSAENDLRRLQEVRNSRRALATETAPAASAPPFQLPQERSMSASERAQNEEARRRVLESTPEL